MTENANEQRPDLPDECPLPPDQLSEAVVKHTDASAPAPLRLMAARGMAPIPPRDLLTAQFRLLWDADDKIRGFAQKSLAQLDPRLANVALGDDKLSPELLAHLAALHAANEAYVEKLLGNRSLPSFAVVTVARSCSERIVSDLIIPNQARLLEEPDIVRALTENEAALKSDVDRAVDFLVRSGVILDGVRAFEEALLRLNGEERVEAASHIDLPKELLDERFLSKDEQAERRLITEEEEEDDQGGDENATIEMRWRSFSVAKKVAAATLGNKSIRTLAMREPNRTVALAAVTSPAITEQEIVAAAGSKTVHADVLNHIVRDRKNNWTRLYPVKLALVNNPKTKLPFAMKLIPSLHGKDLRSLSKSRNVPAGVRNMASKLVKAKQR